MEVRKLFDGIYKVDGKLATINLVKGEKVYGEKLVKDDDVEYRLWDPYRSKLSAAILRGLKGVEMHNKDSVLYLGAATGTTSSHISDIVGKEGLVYCVEISERSMRELLKVCEFRTNMLPILEDARNVEVYSDDVKKVDAIYQDVSAPDQDEILLRNSSLLKKGGVAYVVIKSQSIDISKKPDQIYKEFLERIKGIFKVLEKIDISYYDKKHLFVTLKKL